MEVAPGEELESERYLITIEERLHALSDQTHEVISTTQEKKVKDCVGPLYQPGKRKRQCFKPPTFNQKKPMITTLTEPEFKKSREDPFDPRESRLGMPNKPPSKSDFFNMYSAHSSKRESNIYQISQRKKPDDESPTVLHTPNRSYAACTKWEEQHDQRVPFNMAGHCSAAGKENRFPSSERLSCSNLPVQKEIISGSENKRSTCQILALFASPKNVPQPKMALGGQKVNEANSGSMMDKQLRIWNDAADTNSSQVDAANLSAQTTNSISEMADMSQQDTLENYSFGQDLETGDDLGDSLNLSPDSFAAGSSGRNTESTVLQAGVSKGNRDCDVDMGGEVCEDATQESAFSKSPYQRQNEDWSQNDSESVSPLMRLLTSVDKGCTVADPQTRIGLKKDGKQPCNLSLESSQLDHCNFESPDLATTGHASLVLPPSQSPNLYSTQQSSYSCQKSKPKNLSSQYFEPDSSLPERSLFSCIPDCISPSIPRNDVCTNYKSIPPTRQKGDRFSVNENRFSSHPGSLFAYSELQSQDQNNNLIHFSESLTFRKGYNGLEQWNPSFEQNIEDAEGNFLQSEMSPEFFPSETGTVTQWKTTPIVTTKVIPTDSRSVTAGDGHSWKGSVVSDTVRRGCPSVPMVLVQRQDVHIHPNNVDQRAPPSNLTWIDSISSRDADEDSPCPLNTQGFATSESIALSSTEGFIRNSQLPGEEDTDNRREIVQRVPQLSGRRAPLVTAPPEDLDTQQTDFQNSVAFYDPPTGTCSNEFPLICSKTTATTELQKRGPSQREIGQPHEEFDGNLTEKRQNPKHSTSLGSCRRVGLRRVGLGCKRDLPSSQNAMFQARKEICQKSDSYRPPTAPEFLANNLPGDRSMAGELSFPSAEECDSSVTPTRHVTVPVAFENVMQYRQVFKAALREHLNIVLFELARTYHAALQKVDVSGFGAHEQGNRPSSDGPSCPHGQARLRAVKKDGANKGRLFYTCPGIGQAQCKFFKWADEYQANKTGSKGAEQKSSNKLTLSSSESLMSFFRSHNVAFYCECHLIRKSGDAAKWKFGAAKTKKWGKQKGGDAEYGKKKLYLELSRKDHSSTYSKDDIWIISKTLSFNPDSTFIASSAYYGPSSSGELEIQPISGYSPSNWQSGETVHALMACNAGTELTCISNIEEHVKMQNMPVLPYILQRGQLTVEPNIRNASRVSSFVPPTLGTSAGQLDLPQDVTESLAEEMIARFNLNKVGVKVNIFIRMQPIKIKRPLCYPAPTCLARLQRTAPSLPVCLIHGVFGAGKSFLLAVVVLYLVELFKASDALNQQSNSTSPWKILVSSTTNVAVDRILLGLLELGFEEFVRVGSIRKIAKPVLPYSVHSTGSDSQELKELQSLLKTELTPSERNHVRKGIEQHKLGENKRKLSQVRVVGVTCAACVFPCLDKLKFPVLLLDECSQMTEPASLLPMARFECRKLVLVGDPKQLSPTIQGSEPDHEAGLEQTMFDRLMKMGYEPTLLRTQYRCHPVISAISNRLFYENKLLDGVTAEDRTPVVDLVPTLCFYNVAKGKEKCGRDGSYYNEEEAKFVVFLIECLLESGVEPAQMGVITLYKSQLHTISNNLTDSRATSHAELKAIQISTVDAFQGGEKDVIILSCVRTDHIGFIDCDRRTNVALSRAKRHLLIVGNLKMLSCNTVWGKVIEHCRVFPGGLCNSQDFIKEWKQKEDNDMTDEASDVVSKESSLPEATLNAGQRTDCKEHNRAPSLSKTQSSPTLNEETVKDTEECIEENDSSVPASTAPLLPCQADILSTSSAVEDDSDGELPSFDIFSSLGIQPV
ncbi:hypothetical protein ACROYT_G030806 [Oculina patagonica]